MKLLVILINALIFFSCEAYVDLLDSNIPENKENITITVTSPSNNEILYAQGIQVIEWTTEGLNSNVKIELLRSTSSYGTYSNYETISGYTNNDGYHSWNISNSYSSYYYYKIRISDLLDPTIYVDSDYFQIEEERSITVTTPSYSGSNFYEGNYQIIQWTTEGSISNVKIELLRSTSSSGTYSNIETISSSTNNDGYYSSWYISNSYSSYYYYKIRISDYSDSSVYDDSDYFQIEEERSITVTTPSYSGSNFYEGNYQIIQWTTEGSISNVKIELLRSTSSSGTYSNIETISSSTNNDGYYSSWYISNSYSSYYYYKIRISDYSDSSVYDDSNYFRIY